MVHRKDSRLYRITDKGCRVMSPKRDEDDSRPKRKLLHKRGETSESSACRSDWTSRLVTRLSASLLQHKVTTVEPFAVGPVDDNREITKVGWAFGVCRKEVIWVFGLEGFIDRGEHGTMLSTQVANLTRFGVSGIAWRVLATVVGIEVWTGGFTTAILGDSTGMDVVRQSLLLWKSPEVRMDLDSD